MFSITEYIKGLHIHFEDRKTTVKRTIISAAAIAITAAGVFWIDFAVTEIMTHIG